MRTYTTCILSSEDIIYLSIYLFNLFIYLFIYLIYLFICLFVVVVLQASPTDEMK